MLQMTKQTQIKIVLNRNYGSHYDTHDSACVPINAHENTEVSPNHERTKLEDEDENHIKECLRMEQMSNS